MRVQVLYKKRTAAGMGVSPLRRPLCPAKEPRVGATGKTHLGSTHQLDNEVLHRCCCLRPCGVQRLR
ncbi:hypothetical protein V5799_026940 [Amblyomma americanum]|uniref:Uncharacterized protein n=1 Tax=Amblyomma americanum TaxID=6943 RepID=A0AAQ4DH59_AMBAM